MKRSKMPIVTQETIRAMEDMSSFVHTQIFDDLLIVSQRETSCFVLKTIEGLIIIDAIWPDVRAYQAIINAIQEVGWNDLKIKKLVLTHGHVDHTGCGKHFVMEHNVRTYMSKIDDVFWRDNPTKPNRPDTWKDYEITDYIKEGDIITLGNKNIIVCETPGHTPGCLSYIFPVTDNGIIHMAAIFGGTTPPWTKQETYIYLNSLEHFIERCVINQVDVALSNHTAIDNGLERIRYSKVRMDYMPNIYILGQEGFIKYCEVFRNLGQERISNTFE